MSTRPSFAIELVVLMIGYLFGLVVLGTARAVEWFVHATLSTETTHPANA